jgi:hypothetical protein
LHNENENEKEYEVMCFSACSFSISFFNDNAPSLAHPMGRGLQPCMPQQFDDRLALEIV